jgi:hypothetical protein
MSAPRILIAGRAGSSRKRIMLRKILTDQTYDTVTILSKYSHPLYDFIGKVSELPELESFDRTKTHIVVIDPDNWRDFSLPADFWWRAPHYGITCVYIEHCYRVVPHMVKTSCDILCMPDGAPPSFPIERMTFSHFNGWQIWRYSAITSSAQE